MGITRTRRRALVGTLTLAALVLAGCATGGVGGGSNSQSSSSQSSAPATGGTGGATQTETSAAPLSGEITVWSWDVAAEAMKRLAPDFEKTHPGTKINVVDIGYDNAYDKISVGLQANAGLPDVITVETDHMPGYIAAFPHGFTDLAPTVGDDKADFDPSKWAASSDAAGHLYSIPWDSGTVALYYRSDYLKDAGIDPASLKTWDDVVAAGEKVKTATGRTLLSIDVSSGGTFLMLLQEQGKGIFDAAGNIAISSPEAVRALTLLKTIKDKGLLDNVKGWDGRVTATKDGKSAMHPEAVWWIGTLTSEMPELKGKFGVVPLPVFQDGEAPTSNNGGSTLAVPSQAKNPALAEAFVKWLLTDTGNQVSMMKTEGLFPSYLPALKDPFFHQADPYFGGEKVYELFANLTAEIPAINYTQDYAKATDIVTNAVVASVLNGKDPKAALDDAAKQIATATGRKIAG
jgi:lactose/L-arabinose transport system substrate-binding protein